MADLSGEVTENYLKHIYRLSLDDDPVKTSPLAAALALSPASVSEMLKRLEEQDLVTYRPYQGVSLTTAGRQRALSVLRRHRLWEVFLHRVLGLPWDLVHPHAERLEHATDAELADHLDDFLGNPCVDPHGHPVPSRDGEINEVKRLRLSAVDQGVDVEIVQCSNENSALLEYLQSMDLVPGQRIRTVSQAPFNGPLTIEVCGQRRVVGLEAARTLFVRLASPS